MNMHTHICKVLKIVKRTCDAGTMQLDGKSVLEEMGF